MSKPEDDWLSLSPFGYCPPPGTMTLPPPPAPTPWHGISFKSDPPDEGRYGKEDG